MKRFTALPLIVAALAVTSPALSADRSSQEPGAYLGAGVGYYRIDGDDFLDDDNHLRDNRAAWRVYAGVEANRVVAFEGAYTDFSETSDGLAKTDLHGLSAALLINIPVLDLLAPYAKVGVMSWDRKSSFGPFSDSDDGSDVFYGVGARFSLTRNADMRIEYEHYEIDETDINMASLNFQFRF